MNWTKSTYHLWPQLFDYSTPNTTYPYVHLEGKEMEEGTKYLKFTDLFSEKLAWLSMKDSSSKSDLPGTWKYDVKAAFGRYFAG